MKKSIILLICCIATIFSAWAGPVDSTTAKQVALSFWNQQVQPNRGETQSVDFQNYTSQFGFSNLYLLQNKNGRGYVILSADDRALPILGYSEEGILDPANPPANFLSWLGGYEREIQWAKSQNAPTPSDITEAWTALRNGENITTRQTTSVSPLLTTSWDQGSPYNAQCPGYGYNRAPTGCVATAMAQVMKYWAYPSKGIGSHSYTSSYYNQTLSADFGSTTYNWSSMPNSVTFSNSAVATLMFHCGVAIEMNYEPSGSGAQTIAPYAGYPSAETALYKYFGYKKSLHGESKSSFSDNEWLNMVKADLDAGRPVIYSGFDENVTAGHCFVCDGYNNNNQCHFNWGWSGSYDGYFSLSSLTPGGGGWGSSSSNNYSYNQAAIFGVEPPSIIVNANSAAASIQNGDNASISITYKNTSGASFNGAIRLIIENTEGLILQNIQEYASVSTLANNASANATFSNVISVEPGDCFISLYYKPSGTNTWIRAGAGNVANPKSVTIILNEDPYEANNTPSAPYTFTPSFSNNQATIVTTGSNFHVGDNYDHYLINLPEGYNYDVTSQIYDSEVSYNGTAYSLNVSCKVSQNGGPWGSTYNDTLPDIRLNNGGPLLYRVFPVSSGSVGTYLLKVMITRSANTGIEDGDAFTLAPNVYPNPTYGYVTAECDQSFIGGEWRIFDMTGKLLMRESIESEQTTLDLNTLADGIYLIQATIGNCSAKAIRVVKTR